MSLEVVYCAWNRLEFTRFTFERLLENTNWEPVGELVVYDDASIDGTAEYLLEAVQRAPVTSTFRNGVHRGSSVAVLHDYLMRSRASLFAFVENDLAVPPGWLDALLQVMADHPELELLGTEPNWSDRPGPDWNGSYGYRPYTHIGGSGLMRRSAFRGRRDFPVLNFTGFEIWQSQVSSKAGWIVPDLPVCLLDRHPHDPWRSLSLHYEEQGWQRPWHLLPEDATFYWDWFPE